jgi:type IV pilus assembly protein PilM
MQFITSPEKILGLDISELSLKVVQIKKRKGKKNIQAMNSINVPAGLIEEGVIKDQAKLAKLIKKLIKNAATKFTTKYAVVCLPEPKTFLKVIEVANKEIDQRSTKEIIMDELPRHMPVSMEEAQIDWQEINGSQKQRKFLIGAVPSSVANEYIKVCQMAGLKVVALEIEAQAITRCILTEPSSAGQGLAKLSWRSKNKKDATADYDRPKIILDLGATRTGLILVDHGIIQLTSSLSQISGEKITSKIMIEKKLSYSQAEKAKIICGINPRKCRGAVLAIIKNTVDDLLKQIINADNFYQDHFGQETHDIEIILSGGGAHLSNIDKFLEASMKRNVSVANPLLNLEDILPKKVKNLSAYTTAIGLALRNYV